MHLPAGAGRQDSHSNSSCLRPRPIPLLAEILQRDLDALVVHALELSLELFPALGAAREKLDDMRNRRLTPTVFRLDLCRRPHVNQSVKIIVDDVIEERSDV